jgi:hypothetical protein
MDDDNGELPGPMAVPELMGTPSGWSETKSVHTTMTAMIAPTAEPNA